MGSLSMTSSMAEVVSFLRLPEIVEDTEQEDIFAFDSSFPFCSLASTSESDPISPISHHADAFDPEIFNRIGGVTSGASGSGSFEDIFGSESEVSSVANLLQQRVEQSRSHLLEIGSFESVHKFEYDFGVVERNSEEIGGSSEELEALEPLGLGTIFNLNTDLCDGDGDDDDIGEFIESRREGGENYGGDSASESNRFSSGSNLVRFASNSEEDQDDLQLIDENSGSRLQIAGSLEELEAVEPLGLGGTIFNLNTDLCDGDGEDDIGEFIESRKEGRESYGGDSASERNRFSGGSNLVRFASDSEEDEDDDIGEFVESRKEVGENYGVDSAGESNRFSGGSNLVRFASDSEEDEDDLQLVDESPASREGNDHLNIALCWDSLQLEDHMDGNDEFEWEEVEVLPIAGQEEDQIVERDQSRSLEWEVLLGRSLDLDNNDGFYLGGGQDDYVYTAEYEMTIGENPSIGRPPASKLAIESLRSVTMTEEDVHDDSVLCVVCKDEMGVGELVKQLPCSHRYHSDCIVPWLGIRNTCPICRCELPTDDPDYEQTKAQRAVNSQ